MSEILEQSELQTHTSHTDWSVVIAAQRRNRCGYQILIFIQLLRQTNCVQKSGKL